MGIVRKQLSQSNNMKFLLVLAVAAYAKAEADPGFAYHVGVPLTYAHHYPLAYHHPLVYTAAAGCTNNEGDLVPCAHGVLPTLPYYGVLPAVAAAPAAEAEAEDEAVVSVEKREATAEADADAEADPEADPWYAYYAPHPYSYAPYTYSHVYSHYGLPHHFGYYGKREATAEPEADPEADPWLSYYGLGYAGHPYGYGYHAYSGYFPYAYGGGCRNGYGALVPCARK